MRTIAVAGHICVDLTPELGGQARLEPGALIEVGPLRFSLGGCVANVTRTLTGLGHPVTAWATVGDDDLGSIVQRTLPNALVDARIDLVPSATSYSLVIEPGGDRTFWHHTGANAEFDGGPVDLTSVDLFHLGYPPLLPRLIADEGHALAKLLSRAQAAGATTSVDLAVVDPASPVAALDWKKILKKVAARSDLLSPSLDDLVSALGPDIPGSGALDERYAELLVEWGAAVVAVSSGRDGIVLRTAGEDRLRVGGRALAPLAADWADTRIRMAAPASDAVTTNGAGDATSAGLLYGLSLGLAPQRALEVAGACSAITIRGQIPSMKEVALLVAEERGEVDV